MKRLSGKKYFYWLGQCDCNSGSTERKAARSSQVGCWPVWAKIAYQRGFYGILKTFS